MPRVPRVSRGEGGGGWRVGESCLLLVPYRMYHGLRSDIVHRPCIGGSYQVPVCLIPRHDGVPYLPISLLPTRSSGTLPIRACLGPGRLQQKHDANDCTVPGYQSTWLACVLDDTCQVTSSCHPTGV